MIILDQTHTVITKVNLENGDDIHVIDMNIYHKSVNMVNNLSASKLLGTYDSTETAVTILEDMFNALATQRRTYVMPEFKNNSSNKPVEETTKTEETNTEEIASTPVEDPIDPYEAIPPKPKTARVKANKTTKTTKAKASTKTEDKPKRKYTRKVKA